MTYQVMAQLQINFVPTDLELPKMSLKCTLNILFFKSYPHARNINLAEPIDDRVKRVPCEGPHHAGLHSDTH